MSGNGDRGRVLRRRWRASLVVVCVIPALVCAFAVKSALASFYRPQPILCDGVDDDAASSILCALPEETAKELSSAKPRLHASGKVFCPLIPRSRVIPAGPHRPISFADPSLRFKLLLPQHLGSSEDPDGSH